MNESVKAVLLSALIYPGMGHLAFKKYVSAFVLAIGFSIPLYIVCSEVLVKANQIAEQIKNGDIPLDVNAISQSLSQIMTPSSVEALNIHLYVMAFIWIIAILDAYRLSKLK